jgi:hypothetical protein
VFEWRYPELVISTFGGGGGLEKLELVLVVVQVDLARRRGHHLPENLLQIQEEGLGLRAVHRRLCHSPLVVLVLLYGHLYHVLPFCCFGLYLDSKILLKQSWHLSLEPQKLVGVLTKDRGHEMCLQIRCFRRLDVPLFLLDGGVLVVYSRPQAEELQLST